jgi:hypothetical protein
MIANRCPPKSGVVSMSWPRWSPADRSPVARSWGSATPLDTHELPPGVVSIVLPRIRLAVEGGDANARPSDSIRVVVAKFHLGS